MAPSRFLAVVGLVLSLAATTHAAQPVFDEMPRWKDGWGFQFIEEYRREGDLLSGDKVLGQGLREEVHLFHVEGVYTWDKSIRMTAKLPFVLHAQRELLDGVLQEDRGVGDLTLALPLKSYFNLDGRSGSWTFAPQLRAPLGRPDDYDVYDRAWAGGATLGYETETYRYHVGASATGWVHSGAPPDYAMVVISVGVNVHALGSSGHLKLKTAARHEGDGSMTVSSGPTVYARFTDTVHGQVEWKHDFHDRPGTIDHGNGETFRLGVGFVF